MASTLEERLEQARQREKDARAKAARLRRALDHSNRRRRTQVNSTVGEAVLALAGSGKADGLVAGLRRWLGHYLSRPQDREILRDTPFALEVVTPEAEDADA